MNAHWELLTATAMLSAKIQQAAFNVSVHVDKDILEME